MLFIIMMEVFSRMLKRVEGAGLLQGFKANGWRDGGESVSHLLFANNTIIFLMQKWSKSFIYVYCFFVFKM